MKPLKLKLCAWGPYKDVQEVLFEHIGGNGLFLITGPTGAGKTTIFDGITYALYGEVSGELREKDSLRSDFAGEDSDTYVELSFSHKGHLFEVYRTPKYYRKKKRGEGLTEAKEEAVLKIDGEVVAAGPGQVTEKIISSIRIDYKQFKQISMLAQGEFQKLLIANSKDRAKIFRDIFNTRVYDSVLVLLGNQTKSLSGKIKNNLSRLEELTLALFTEENEEWELLVKGGGELPFGRIIEKGEEEIDTVQKKINDFEKKINFLGLQIREQLIIINERKHTAQLIDKLKLKEKEYKGLKEKLQVLTKSYEEVQRQYESLEILKQQIEDYRAREETLSRRLTILSEYDIQEKALNKQRRDYLEAENKVKTAKRKYEEQERRLKEAAIGLLAENLVQGEPCPVCGSLEHPKAAAISYELPNENAVSQLKKGLEKLQEDTDRKHIAAIESLSILNKLKKDYLLFTDSEIEEDAQNIPVLQKERINCGHLIQKNKEQCEEIEKKHKELAIELESSRILMKKLKDEIEQLETEVPKTPVDLEDVELRVQMLEQEKKRLEKEKERASAVLINNQKILALMKGNYKAKVKLEEEYGLVKDLENVTRGNNRLNLIFEQYVLSVYFDHILSAANKRLLLMSDGRYELFRVKEAQSARSKDSLEIEVLDYYTGKNRSIKTLSGGESFKAALALALGMSDTVRNYSGAIEINTLFIDEGFGALDTESLDQAIDALFSLTGDGRLIGIISHVQELKERIENQITVEKTNAGSRIKQ